MENNVYSCTRGIDDNCIGYKYTGYINSEYAGFMVGYKRNDRTIDIQCSELEEQFRGTKAVRAIKELVEFIHNDFDIILCRVHNKLNSSLKIVLDVGFTVMGTMSDGESIFVELMKVKREDI